MKYLLLGLLLAGCSSLPVHHWFPIEMDGIPESEIAVHPHATEVWYGKQVWHDPEGTREAYVTMDTLHLHCERTALWPYNGGTWNCYEK